MRATDAQPLPVLIAALIAGASYWPASRVLPHDAAIILWKGAGVGLLALWAAVRAGNASGRLLAATLGLGAVGDMLLEAAGQTIGAVAFLMGHLVAIALYRRERGADGGAIGLAIAVTVALLAFLFTRSVSILLYASALGAMAGAAWTSRFPRRTVATGALLFALSDLLIFARMGPFAGSPLPGLLIWPTYFAGQALIAWGVATTLGRRLA